MNLALCVTAPEKSELLADSKDPVIVLRNFKTMLVDASKNVAAELVKVLKPYRIPAASPKG